MCEGARRQSESSESRRYSEPFQPNFLCYLAMREKSSSIKGKRIHFQLSLDDVKIYHAKLKGKHPTGIDIPIHTGSECHYSASDNYLLRASHDFKTYTMTHEGVEIFHAVFEKHKEEEAPKNIKVEWKPNDGTQPITLVNKIPEKNDEGKWILDYEGRYAEPSIKNCILIDPEDNGVRVMIRKVDSWEQDIDAKQDMPDLMLFALLLCLNICTF